MESVKYLVIGGGIAALSAAKRAKKLDAEGSVLIVSEDKIPPYDLPPLSKDFLRGIKSEQDIIYESEDKLEALGVKIELETRVEALDVQARTVTVSGGRTIGFEKAIYATGTRPVKLPVPGADLPGVHYLRTAEDAKGLAKDANKGGHAVVIGAGFIGLETAASLRAMGVEVTIVEAQGRVWPRFGDATLASFFQEYCQGKGVKFVMNEQVTSIGGNGKVEKVTTASGAEIPCDFVCVGIGIRPNVELAQAAGLKVDNGVVVDDLMQTNIPGIYAAGDVINYREPLSGERRRAEHWGHAEYSGQIAGGNAAGGATAYDFINYAWSDVFDLHLESSGDEGDHDDVVVRGDLSAGKFTLIYLKDGAIQGYCGVNAEVKEFTTFRRLMRQKTNLKGREDDLRDPAFNPRGLL